MIRDRSNRGFSALHFVVLDLDVVLVETLNKFDQDQVQVQDQIVFRTVKQV